jgi:hypothetical protein
MKYKLLPSPKEAMDQHDVSSSLDFLREHIHQSKGQEFNVNVDYITPKTRKILFDSGWKVERDGGFYRIIPKNKGLLGLADAWFEFDQYGRLTCFLIIMGAGSFLIHLIFTLINGVSRL